MLQSTYPTFALVKNKQKERINEKQKGFILALFCSNEHPWLCSKRSRKMSSDNEETEKEMKAERRSILKTEKVAKG